MLTMCREAEHAEVIKKSKFIARAAPVSSADAAMAFLERVSEPHATHNCWAYKIDTSYRFHDDGEPGGTAGRPILAAIEGQGVDHVVVVVTRYFGGIKLGAGGLVRAYGGVAAECLRRAEKRVVKPTCSVRIHAPFEATGELYLLVERLHARRGAESYEAAGLVLDVDINADAADVLEQAVNDVTRGRGRVVRQ